MFHLKLFRIRAFAAGNLAEPAGLDRPRRPAVHADHLAAGHLAAAARLRLRQHTPLWAGIYMLPLTVGFLVAGPVSGCAVRPATAPRPFATGGLLLTAASFAGLMLLPVDFAYLAVRRCCCCAQRHRLGPVRRAQLGRDHELACRPASAAPPPACGPPS